MKGSVRKKNNNWYYSFDLGIIDGKRKRIEKAGGSTKREAEKALREALQKYELTGKTFEPSNMSFQDFLEYWFKNYVLVSCKLNTQISYRVIIDKHINPVLGSYKLKNINPAILQEFLVKKTTGYTKNSIAGFYGVLSGSLKYAVYPMQYLKENPVQHVKMPKIETAEKKRDLILTCETVQTILDRFPRGTAFYIPILIAFHTGMRAGEVCALTWDKIDFEKKVITVSGTLIYKGKKQHEITSPKT